MGNYNHVLTPGVYWLKLNLYCDTLGRKRRKHGNTFLTSYFPFYVIQKKQTKFCCTPQQQKKSHLWSILFLFSQEFFSFFTRWFQSFNVAFIKMVPSKEIPRESGSFQECLGHVDSRDGKPQLMQLGCE